MGTVIGAVGIGSGAVTKNCVVAESVVVQLASGQPPGLGVRRGSGSPKMPPGYGF